MSSSSLASMFEGWGGTVHGKFFLFPPSSSSPLHRIHQSTVYSQLRNYVTLTYFVYTPNLVWFLLAVLLWILVPYPLSTIIITKSPTTTSFVRQNNNNNDDSDNHSIITVMTLFFQQRLLINLMMVWTYYGFWHVALYVWYWGKRPWIRTTMTSDHPISSSSYSLRWTKVIHNAWYTTLGTLQWTLTETAILYVVYVQQPQQQQDFHSSAIVLRTNDAISSPPVCVHTDRTAPPAFSWTWWWILINVVSFALLVPAIRDVHFYVSHRFLHIRFLYKYVHSLHHRNTTEVEPFSGLSMHPTEHLYYFTCYGPWLAWMVCWNTMTNASLSADECKTISSPGPPAILAFGLFWMGLHVLLSPAASHSGFEDHWQSDLYHYLHHRYFDCNYASPALPFDKWMGTFRDRWVDDVQQANDDDDNDNDNDDNNNNNNNKKNMVVGNEKHITSSMTMRDPKASVMLLDGGLPTREEVLFYLLGVLLPVSVLLYCCLGDDQQWRRRMDHRCLAMLLATFPILAAALLHGWSFRSGNTDAQQSLWKHYMAPFHNDSRVSIVLHFGVGSFICCILPIYYLLSALLAPPVVVFLTAAS